MHGSEAVASVIIPAHNEEHSIGRLLHALTSAEPGSLEILVVCNGCTDGTAEVAASFPRVQVLSSPVASKRSALRLGDERATTMPRVYVDADVVIDSESVHRLTDALAQGPVLAAGPRRVVPRTGTGWVVRNFYDVWEHLPQVRDGLFGRGVIALSREGNDRIRALPPVMSDDLAFSEAFAPAERVIVEKASVVVHPPRTTADLLRRRIRSVTGNAEADAADLRGASSRTRLSTLAALGLRHPRLVPKIPVFVVVSLVARVRARRPIRSGDFTTWLRDESSRG
jgi:glycosyltransferase involved in cell wall biosynthesis